MKHKFSKEILYHFNCGICNKWWSIADYHLNTTIKKEVVVAVMGVNTAHTHQNTKK